MHQIDRPADRPAMEANHRGRCRTSAVQGQVIDLAAPRGGWHQCGRRTTAAAAWQGVQGVDIKGINSNERAEHE